MLGGLGQPVLLPPGGSLPPPLLGDPGGAFQPPPPRPGEGGTGAAVGVSEFRRVCSRANLTVRAPRRSPASGRGLAAPCRGAAVVLN